MTRSRVSLIALSVIVLWGVWHIFADQQARFASELLEVELGDASSNLIIQKDRQAQLVQEILNQALEGDNKILKKLEELQVENEKLRIRSGHIVRHMADTTPWKPLKDLTKFSIYSFMSEIVSREEQGNPELFEFPSDLSDGRHLCFRGNDTHNGTRNSYAFAWEEALPSGYVLLNGTTLISETEFDYNNPWHSHFNLLQFVWWTLQNGCEKADRFLIYHWSELRRTMGDWITRIFTAAGLPTQPYEMPIGDRPICFQRALVSRLGIGSVPQETLQYLYAQVRCQVRTLCKLPTTRAPDNGKKPINVTLMVRSGAREWKDAKAWERVIDEQCSKVEGCRRTNMYVAEMTFCEQGMMETDILVSVHGAQLTNMIFMSPGGRILEMFPKGWLELAGGGQYIYKVQSLWNGLIHEGYWRDVDQPDCPTPEDNRQCMTYYKDQNVGINETYISSWLGGVLDDFKSAKLSPANSNVDSHGDYEQCDCRANERPHQETA